MSRTFVRANNQYYEAFPSVPDRAATLSIGAWIYLTSLPASATFPAIIQKGNTTSQTGRAFNLQYREFFGRFLLFNWYGAAQGGLNTRDFAWTAALNRWYHLLVTCDWTKNPDDIKIYLDGVSQTLTVGGNNNDPPSISGTQITRIGRETEGTEYWNNKIAEVFLTPVVLGAAHAKALALGRVTPDRLGVVLDAYWPLWGDDGVEPDRSGSNRIAVPSGGPFPTPYVHPVARPVVVGRWIASLVGALPFRRARSRIVRRLRRY